MKTSAWLLVGALATAGSGCDSEVVGGGGGAGGAGSGGAPTSGEGGSTAETTGETTGVTSTSTSAGGGGTGGGYTLGECESQGGTGATASGMFECQSDYTCDAGEVSVSCLDDGTSETCDCYFEGSLGGSCVNDGSGCSFPVNCCYALLGGHAEPNPDPYGACEPDDGSSAQSGGGETACGATYTCDGGGLWIDCSGTDAGATCECSDDQGFLLGTCEQPDVDCDYASGCCFDLVN